MITNTEPMLFADTEDAIEQLSDIKAPHIIHLIEAKVELLALHARAHQLRLEDSPEHQTIIQLLNLTQDRINRGYNSLWN